MKDALIDEEAATSASSPERQISFEQIAFEYMDALYQSALHLTRNRFDAEDLVQDVYLRAFRFYHRFEQGTNFKAWVFKILRNTFINGYRKSRRAPYVVEFERVEFMMQTDDDQADSGAYLSHSEEAPFRDIFSDDVHMALNRLSEDFRLVVLLADLQGFRYKEIAEIMGCPIGTVMSRLSRARQQLQRLLKEYASREGYLHRGAQTPAESHPGDQATA